MMEEAGERTQMVAPVDCPVCAEPNAAGATWCAECGFRLGSAPGPAGEAAPPAHALAGDGRRHPLKAGENAVGRLEADVFLSDPSVSRRHATVSVSDEAVTVRDEGSSNGTMVNDARIEPGEETALRPGDTVQFGAVRLTLEAPSGAVPAASEKAAPEMAPEGDPPAGEPREAVGDLTDGAEAWPLWAGRNTIGRRPDNDVTLTDPAVSGRHAALTIEDGEARISDSGSANGTFIDDERVTPGEERALEPGAALRFGRVTLRYEPRPAAPDGAPGE